MATGTVTNLVFVRAQTGRAANLESALRELAQASRNEPGNLSYKVHRSTSDGEEYFIYGVWRSQTDLETHMSAPAIKAFLEKGRELVNGGFNLRLFTRIYDRDSSR